MNPLDIQIEAAAAMLRAAGGVVGIDQSAPDHVKRAFLEMLMDCPDCRAAMMGKGEGNGN